MCPAAVSAHCLCAVRPGLCLAAARHVSSRAPSAVLIASSWSLPRKCADPSCAGSRIPSNIDAMQCSCCFVEACDGANARFGITSLGLCDNRQMLGTSAACNAPSCWADSFGAVVAVAATAACTGGSARGGRWDDDGREKFILLLLIAACGVVPMAASSACVSEHVHLQHWPRCGQPQRHVSGTTPVAVLGARCEIVGSQ